MFFTTHGWNNALFATWCCLGLPGCWLIFDDCMGCKKTRDTDAGIRVTLTDGEDTEPSDAAAPDVGLHEEDGGQITANFDRNFDGRQDACELQFTGATVWSFGHAEPRAFARVWCFLPEVDPLDQVKIVHRFSPSDEAERRECLAPQTLVSSVRVRDYFWFTMPHREPGSHAVSLEIQKQRDNIPVGGDTVCYLTGDLRDGPIISPRLGPRCDAAGLEIAIQQQIRRELEQIWDRLPPGGEYLAFLGICLLTDGLCSVATIETIQMSLLLDLLDEAITVQERDFGLDAATAALAHGAVTIARIRQGVLGVMKDAKKIRHGPEDILVALRPVIQDPSQAVAVLNRYREDFQAGAAAFWSTYSITANVVRLVDDVEAIWFEVHRNEAICRAGENEDTSSGHIILVTRPEDEMPPPRDPLSVDDDHDGYSENHGDCDDANPARRPGLRETCDNLDNNCDFIIDNLGSTSCGLGPCRVTIPICVRGVMQICVPREPRNEICGNFADENCNGIPDDPDICLGDRREVCNNADDDGDGRVDEDFVCRDGDIAACMLPCGRIGNHWCGPDGLLGLACEWSDCLGDCGGCVPTGHEVCDGRDNDCVGGVDDGLGSTTCGTGACERTVQNCRDGFWWACSPGAPSPEVCNGMDDDCNGERDDGGVCDGPPPACNCGEPCCDLICQNERGCECRSAYLQNLRCNPERPYQSQHCVYGTWRLYHDCREECGGWCVPDLEDAHCDCWP